MKPPDAVYPRPPSTWQEVVRPIIATCELASKFNQAVTLRGPAAHALGELLRQMAKNLDDRQVRCPLAAPSEEGAQR